ncbi:MAG: hypothetical protein F6I01_002150 [Aerococcus sanguinicola]
MTFEELADFIGYLFETEQDEELWEIWMQNPLKEGSFEDFKKEVLDAAIEEAKSPEQKELEVELAVKEIHEAFGVEVGE